MLEDQSEEQEESIPAGCVPPASVATTRWQYQLECMWVDGFGYVLK